MLHPKVGLIHPRAAVPTAQAGLNFAPQESKVVLRTRLTACVNLLGRSKAGRRATTSLGVKPPSVTPSWSSRVLVDCFQNAGSVI
jgi:hypothetical protein